MGPEKKSDKYNLRSKKNEVEKYKKKLSSSDDDDDSEFDDDYDSEDENTIEINNKEYTKFLSKLFPSKHMTNKVKQQKKSNEDDGKIHIVCTIDDRGSATLTSDTSSCDELSYDEDDDDDENEDDGDEEDDEDEDDSDGDDEDEDDGDGDGDDEDDGDEEDDDDDDQVRDNKTTKSKSQTGPPSSKKPNCGPGDDDDVIKTFQKLTKDFSKKHNKSKAMKEILRATKDISNEYKKAEDKKSKAVRGKNVKKFKTIVRENNSLSDYQFFEKMPIREQEIILKELNNVYKVIKVEKPYRLKLLESDIPLPFKACALRKINTLRHMDPMAGDYYKLQYWVDAFMRIPFNKYKNLPISHLDGQEKCQNFMENAIQSLNGAVYGMNDAKMQIIQMIGQWITNPNAIGTAIAIKGPPGTGKTTLVKEGISKLLNREFAFIALGGATDSSFLEGHSYTYEGSTWGKIVDILIQKQSMNPVIYFDELDKISDTPKGEEIVGILTHLTDTSQNDKYHDKYFSEIDFDLSKCLFIFSYNDESKINPVLIDRMYRIQTNGYNCKEKIHIVKDYLLPKIRKDVNMDKDITFPDEIISYIIESYTGQEKGVRNLKRCIEVIYRKLNLYDIMRPGTKLFDDKSSIKVEFPLIITKDLIDKMIKTQDTEPAYNNMYL
tara:strand:- start:980 stop:2965 length:1986 start_codon:yes stop_codon:yes gene_type:complete